MSASSSSTPSSSSAASATSASTAVSSRPTTAVVEVSALVVGRSGGSSSCSLRSRRAIASSISSTRASQCCRSAFGAGDTRCSVYMSTERTCARSKMGPRHRQPSRFAFARRMGSRSLGSAPSARAEEPPAANKLALLIGFLRYHVVEFPLCPEPAPLFCAAFSGRSASMNEYGSRNNAARRANTRLPWARKRRAHERS